MSRWSNLWDKLRPTRRPELEAKIVDDGGIYDGTVGWEDNQPHYDLLDGEIPLVKVTLYLGHNPVTEGENKNPARARGRRIVARFDPKASDIPEDGESVIVAVPKGRSNVNGASMIIGRPNPDPKWIPNRKPGEKIIQGPGDSFIRLKQDGSIHLYTRETPGDGGKTVCLQVRPDGFVFEHPHMRVTAGPNGYHAVHSSGARIDFGSIGGLPAPLDALASWMKLSAALVHLEASATSIGPDGGVQDNLVKAKPTLAAFAAIETTMASVALALAAVGVDLTTLLGGAATSTTPLANAATALGALATTLAAYPPLAPTQALTGA